MTRAGRILSKPISGGFVLSQSEKESLPHELGDFAIFTNDPTVVVDHCWFRGGWFDPLTITWETIQKAETKKVEPVDAGAPGASLYVPFNLAAGQEKIIRVMMSWYVPVTDLRFGNEASEKDKCDPSTGCCGTSDQLGEKIANDESYTSGKYKPWYSSKFKSVKEVAEYWTKTYDDLHQKSALFRDTFYSSTLPPK